MSLLGIYFGPKVISLVETKGHEILNNAQASKFNILGFDLEEKVPEELKIVSVFKEAFEKNQIQSKEAVIVVSGKDLIIRTFDMPFIPLKELPQAVNFEVKKYMPFKVEDLVSDFQVRQDRASQKNLVLFVGIKKESLDKYLAISQQLELKINAIEYSAFSILSLLKLSKVKLKGIVAVASIDLKEEDEANFMVLKDGFPLFSRDIVLISDSFVEDFKAPKTDPALALEKLKGELRVSLDFYHRKFSNQNIEKLFFISPDEHHAELEAFVKEKGFSAQFLEFSKYLGKSAPYSLSILKAYSGCLCRTIKTGLIIDLARARTKKKISREVSLRGAGMLTSLSEALSPRIIIMALLIYLLPFAYVFYKKIPLERELSRIISMRLKIDGVVGSASYESLKEIDAGYRRKITEIGNLINKQIYLTEILDTLPRIIPEDIWLRQLDFKIEKLGSPELGLSGFVQTEDKDAVLGLINDFAATLKENPVFKKYFNKVKIESVEQQKYEEAKAGEFVISCSAK